MNNKSIIREKVRKLYIDYPFPNLPINNKQDLYKTDIYRIVYSLSKPFINQYSSKTIKIIDIGCGTGELMLGMSQPKMRIDAIDLSGKSLTIAKQRSNKFAVKNIKFMEKDFLKDKFRKDYYDFSFSIGALHHMTDPEKAFKKLVGLTKPGGYIIVGLYNPYGRMATRIKRRIISIIAGEDTHKRVDLAKRLFYKDKVEQYEKIDIADRYAHPHETYTSAEDILRWFKKIMWIILCPHPQLKCQKILNYF
jgi:ubiquinone/menaquinone biosynthesis C-methylase UbiE